MGFLLCVIGLNLRNRKLLFQIGIVVLLVIREGGGKWIEFI